MAFTRAAWALLAVLTQGMLLAAHKADDAPLVVLFSTDGTRTTLVQEVLSAAGVHILPQAPTGRDAQQVSQYLLQATQQGPPGPRPATPQHSRVSAFSLQGTLQHLQTIIRALPAVRIVHVVRDFRQSMLQALNRREAAQHEEALVSTSYSQLAAHWAQDNAAVKTWATTQGLGLERRYSLARIEDLCNSTRQHAAVQALLRNAGLDASASAVGSAAAAISNCPRTDWQAQFGTASAAAKDAVRAIDADMRDALAAFGYEPLTGLGFPSWLEAKSALANIHALSNFMATSTAPAVVTFVSNGYEPIMNNWLTWLKHSGVDVTRVVVVTPRGHVSSVRGKLKYKGVNVVAIDPIEPDNWKPGTPYELGAKKDPKRHARAMVWLQRIRVLYQFVNAGVSVIMSDLDAIWIQNAVADLLRKGQEDSRGFDLMMSPGYFPFDVHKQMGVVGCMGFLYANATSSTCALLGTMLREKLHQLELREVKFYNDQRVLNEQLLLANIAVNNTAGPRPRPQGNPEPVLGEQLTTAPDALRVLYLSDVQYARVCSNTTVYSDAVVVHCQAHNSGAAKRAYLHRVGLWKEDAAEQEAEV